MNYNKIIFDKEAREKIKNGIDKVADVVKITLGPKGRNIVYKKINENNSVVTNDGVTIAKTINLKDEFENIGASLIKESAQRTNDEVGDGTTTATILTQAMINEGLDKVSKNVNAIEVRSGMQKAVEEAITFIKQNSKEIKSKEEIKNVAKISCGDEELAEVIAEVLFKVGKNGIVTIDSSNKTETSYDVVGGMILNTGYISPYMVVGGRNKAELKEPYIFITDKSISNPEEIDKIASKVVQGKKINLVIIAKKITGIALKFIIANVINHGHNIIAIDAPEFGNTQTEILDDLAVFTGGTFFTENNGYKLDNLSIEHFGRADKVIVDSKRTIIVDGKGEKIEERKEQLKKLSEEENEENENLKKRIANLEGGIGVIKVGSSTQIELNDKVFRVEDAVNSSRVAMEEGIVAGGGKILLSAKKLLEDRLTKKLFVKTRNGYTKDELIGYEIVKNSLSKPVEQIIKNCGIKNSSKIIKNLSNSKLNEGFDFSKNKLELVDLIEKGIVDPTKVELKALKNSCSVASSILTTEVAIVEKEFDKV